jgi:hypothetical protein
MEQIEHCFLSKKFKKQYMQFVKERYKKKILWLG